MSENTPFRPLPPQPIELKSRSLVINFETMADGGIGKPKEITAKLKEAKEAISKKEYKDAAKHCRVSEKY